MTDLATQRHDLADLNARYSSDSGEFLFTGVQALVRLPFEQLRVDRKAKLRTAALVSGYQGSPLGTFDSALAAQKELLAEYDVVHRPGLNEELGATAVMGSQLAPGLGSSNYDGVVGIWYGKAPGLDRAGDAIRHANYAGTSAMGGAIALVGDDPSCKSSTVPSSSDYAMSELHMPVLYPGTVQEVLDFGRHAIAVSRATGLWSALKIVTPVADGTGSALVHQDRLSPVIPTMEVAGSLYVPTPRADFVWHPLTIEEEIYNVRLPLARQYAELNPSLNQVTVDPRDAWLGIIAPGRIYYEVMAALSSLGLGEADLARHGIRVLRLGMIYPLDRDLIHRFAEDVDDLLVVEEKRPFLESAIRDILYGSTRAPRVLGKTDDDLQPLIPNFGSLEADKLTKPVARVLQRRIDASNLRLPMMAQDRKLLTILPPRTPYFCSGCPHSTGTKAPAGALVGTGIGCHGMAPLMAPERVGNILGATQMGGEGSQWIGIEPFVSDDHLIQNIGDGTYFHSGALAVRAAVAAESNITYKILYNATVAMTGGQDAGGSIPVPELAGTLLLEGVKQVIITTDDVKKYRRVKLPKGVAVWPRSRIIAAQEDLAKIPGVTALIHDQECAAELRRDRKRGRSPDPEMRIVINERVCEGCGDCGDVSNCLSVQPAETDFGRKTKIHQSSCNKDFTCLDGDCPSFLSVTPRKRGPQKSAKPVTRASGGGRRMPLLELADLQEPTPVVPVERFTVRMPGIGGTGVLTISQLLSTAAMLDDHYVSGVDQTGLSQKAGPVVSQLTISTTPVSDAGVASDTEVDTYLVFDLLVALSEKNLAAVSENQTVVVASTSRTPTGAMVIDTDVAYPQPGSLQAELDGRTRRPQNIYLDAQGAALGLFGDAVTSNVIVLGSAFQQGCIPISADSIEQAIEINGAAVQANKLAFRWGRMIVQDQERVAAAMSVSEGQVPALSAEDLATIGSLDVGQLGRTLRSRVPELVLFQDRALATRYINVVSRVAKAERAIGHEEFVVTESVARFLYKLMAYKDEYEVSRLMDPALLEPLVSADVGEDVRISYNLHPPFLRAWGMNRKLRLGPWFRPALGALAAGKKVRGTPFDPFGYSEVRRTERALIEDYIYMVGEVADALTVQNRSAMLRLVGLPDMVRGYEEIKLANVRNYRQAVEEQRLICGLASL